MNLYFAPLEGITTYTYRNTHAEFFGGCDGYFAPFITPSDNEKIGMKCLRDINPDVNKTNVTVQVLTNRADSFHKFEHKIRDLGYDSVNINLGCPSGTVVKKNRGSGFLRDPEGIERFLDGVFDETKLKISIKTRSGFASGAELDNLMEVYNRYKLTSLIIHPRARADFYNGVPDMAVFEKAYNISQNDVCYNGNVFSKREYTEICEKFPRLEGVMFGRGAVMNPAIFREIKGGSSLETRELIEFTGILAERYLKVLGSEIYTLHKLKEIWMYIMWNFPDEKKTLKAVKKSDKLGDLLAAIRNLPEIPKE